MTDDLAPPTPPPKRQRATAMVRAVARTLGLRGDLPKEWHEHIEAGVKFSEMQTKVLAEMVGTGECGPGPGSLVQTAALQLILSRYLAAKGMNEGDPAMLKLGSEMGNHSRQNLLAAVALCQSETAGKRPDKRRKKKTLAELLTEESGEDEKE